MKSRVTGMNRSGLSEASIDDSKHFLAFHKLTVLIGSSMSALAICTRDFALTEAPGESLD